RVDQVPAVGLVGHVTGNGHAVGAVAQLGLDGGQVLDPPGVQHQPPPPVGKASGQGPPQSPRSSCDQRHRHRPLPSPSCLRVDRTPVSTVEQVETCSTSLWFGSQTRWVRQHRASRPCHPRIGCRGGSSRRPPRRRALADLTRRVPAPGPRPPPDQPPDGRPPALTPRNQALGSEPTTLTKLTHSPGEPPRLWVRASFLPAAIEEIVRSGGASPRSWSQHSKSMRRPLAPIGWPKALRPPSGLTGSSPSRSKVPASASFQPVPRSQKPRSSMSTISVGVKQSCTSARASSERGSSTPACR